MPEATDYIASNAVESVALAQSMETSPFVLGLRKAAKDSSLAINVGIHVPALNGKLSNRSCWINEQGDIESFYDKVHVFDYGTLKESNSVEGGKSIIPPVETIIGRVGLAICFDVRPHRSRVPFVDCRQLRFPEIGLALKRQNAQIITYPSAFTVPTGKAHWEILLRSRAIETQTYVIASAQVGSHNEKRTSYGHSMVVDPWGKILLDMPGEDSGPDMGIVHIDLDYQEKIKTEMPLLRRTYVELPSNTYTNFHD